MAVKILLINAKLLLNTVHNKLIILNDKSSKFFIFIIN